MLRSKDASQHFFSDYLTSILSLDSFKMSEIEYRIALTGLPVSEKGQTHNT